MAGTTFYLTNEQADIAGYLRMSLNVKSACPSMVRTTTNSQAGPISSPGIQPTYTSIPNGFGTVSPLQWISDPLDGTVSFTAHTWIFHLWANENIANSHMALRYQLYKYSSSLAAVATLDYNPQTELVVTTQDSNATSGNATVTVMNAGDRIVFIPYFIDSSLGNMVSGRVATLSINGQQPAAEGSSYITTATDTFLLQAVIPGATESAVRTAVQDEQATQVLTTADIDQGITRALQEYSVQDPRNDTQYISGDGVTYEYPLPRFWINGISRIHEIEYPADTQVRTVIGQNDWEVLGQVLGQQPQYILHFITITPTGTPNNVKLRYTTAHRHDTLLDTIPVTNYQAFVQLGAAYACLVLAARYSALGDSSINADSVDYKSKADDFLAVAKELRKRYEQMLGIGVDNPPIGFFGQWSTTSSWGQDRLIHRHRLRST